MATATTPKARTREPAANGKLDAHTPARTRSRATSPKRAPAPAPDADTLAMRHAAALKIATAAQRKAAKIAADVERNRSTRTRAALKARSDALDEVAAVLAGKDAAND